MSFLDLFRKPRRSYAVAFPIRGAHISGFYGLTGREPIILCDTRRRTVRLGDYYVRELERKGTERRQVVVYEIIGTGRTGQLARTKWERQVKPV